MGIMRFKYLFGFKQLITSFFKRDKQDFVANIINRLFRLMSQEKPYLNCNFCIENLAGRLNVSSYLLSQIITNNLEQNFADLVVYYRIQEAKNILENPKVSLKTEDTLAFEVGYNSKTKFDTDFKIHTSQSPIEYRKQMNLIFE